MQLGKLGVWAFTDGFTAKESARFAAQLEAWGYSALWFPEAFGRNALAQASWLLASTQKLIVATGIANIYARGAMAMHAGQLTLGEQSGGRFILGLGVSHAPMVEGAHGQSYDPKPVSRMRAYLEQMSRSPFQAPPPPEPPPVVLAALGPKMLELARDLTAGAHPYNVTPEHTAQARRILGPDKWLCVEQKVMLELDASKARALGRQNLEFYLKAPNYVNNFRRLGFTDADFAGQGSDRIIDALVAWGDLKTIQSRIQAHFDAGASHVCIQPLSSDANNPRAVDERVLKLLAPKQ